MKKTHLLWAADSVIIIAFFSYLLNVILPTTVMEIQSGNAITEYANTGQWHLQPEISRHWENAHHASPDLSLKDWLQQTHTTAMQVDHSQNTVGFCLLLLVILMHSSAFMTTIFSDEKDTTKEKTR